MENKIWKTKSYLRLSKEDTDNQCQTPRANACGRESDSIVNQRALIEDFIKGKADMEFCGERCDDGVSGVSFDRPAFNALMDDIRDGSIDCIIVKDLSRFGRNHIEAGNLIENLFPILGVRFIAINDGIDTLNPKTASDSILIPFKNLINDAYCRDISIKIRSQFAVKRKRGQFVGAFASYGYMKHPEDKNKLIIDEGSADYVREIFRLKVSGMSADAIAKRFNAMGILSPLEYKVAGGQNYTTNFKTNMEAKWSATAILRILKNPVYIGTLVQGREGTPNHKIKQKKKRPREEWAVVEDSHEPIISAEAFDDAGKALLLDTRMAPLATNIYLFSGMLICGHCGCGMVRKTVPSSGTSKNGGKKYIYYVCSGNKKRGSCSARGIREDMLTDTILMALQMRIAEIVDMSHILSFVDTVKLSKIRVSNLKRQLKEREDVTLKCQRFKKSLYETYIDGTISKADYDLFYADYTKDQSEATAQAEMLQNEMEAVLSNKDEYGIWLESFKEHRNLTELNRSILINLIDRIVVHSKEVVEVTFRYQSEYDKLVLALADTSLQEVG